LPFTFLPLIWAKLAAAIFMSGAGIVLLILVSRLLSPDLRTRILLPGLLFIPVWEELAGRAGHLDDVLALTFAVAALLAVQRQHAVAAGVLLAFAADAKPWALAFVVLLLVLPAHRRFRALTAWAAAVAMAWLPFLIADPRSVIAASYRIQNAAGSALRALGVTDPSTPVWCRPAQLILGASAAYLLWRRGRAAAIILAVIAVRLLLDPATWSYYTAGLLVGTLIVDVCRTRQRWPIPWFTLGGFIAVYLPNYVHAGPMTSEAVHGYLRAGFLCAALIGAYLTTTELHRLAEGPYGTISLTAAPLGVKRPGDSEETNLLNLDGVRGLQERPRSSSASPPDQSSPKW
jgi:hypothetical protein